MKKLFTCAAIAAAALASVSAQAATIGFASVDPLDGSYKGSPVAGVFTETFDKADGSCDLTQTGASISGGTYNYAKGSVYNGAGTQIAAPPLNNSTCYAYGPADDNAGGAVDPTGIPLPPGVNPGDVLASITIDYSGLIATLGGGAYLNYFGLYYGSIDSYNMLEFFDANGAPVDVVYGQEIIDRCAPACAPGSQTAEGTNQYVNLLLDPNETFASIRFTTWGRAVEVDNFSVGFGVTAIPEPASLALLGVGLAGLGLVRRRQAKKA